MSCVTTHSNQVGFMKNYTMWHNDWLTVSLCVFSDVSNSDGDMNEFKAGKACKFFFFIYVRLKDLPT